MEVWSNRKHVGSKGSSLSIGEKTTVANAYKATWQQVQKEASQELVYWQSHDALTVAIRGVSLVEADSAFGKGEVFAVGDADTVGVRAEIAQSVLRSTECPF